MNNTFLLQNLLNEGTLEYRKAVTEIKGKSSNSAVLTLLKKMNEQNKQILKYLNKQGSNDNSVNLPELPISLPLKKEEDVNVLENFLGVRENFLALVSYLSSSVRGKDTTSMTNNVLKRLLTNELACNYSFRGKRGKKAFERLLLTETVVRAVKCRDPHASEKNIEEHIKVWLKHSPQRHKVECAKKKEGSV